jgi:hypothetical protein
MRYQNWDVLLFPGNSRVPVQEFSTACHVVSDQSMSHSHVHICSASKTDDQADGLAASKWGPSEDPFVISHFESTTKTPMLTCFVSSLPSGTSFRVSIHSWAKTSPSALLKSRKGIDEPIAFQIRVYIDGALQR